MCAVASRLLERPASESGTLRQVDGDQGRRDRPPDVVHVAYPPGAQGRGREGAESVDVDYAPWVCRLPGGYTAFTIYTPSEDSSGF